MMESPIRSSASVLAGLLLLSACADGPASPEPRPETGFLETLYECTANVQSGSTSCHVQSVGDRANGPMFDMIAGPIYVPVTTSGAVISNGDPANQDTMTLTFTLTNLTPQPIGTTDGTTPHPNGNRMFFSKRPVAIAAVAGVSKPAALTVRLVDALGPANFTSVATGSTWLNALYYQFDGVLAPNDSASKPVRFVYDPRVTQISYQVLVSAPAQYEYGWVTIAPLPDSILGPGDTAMLTATVHAGTGVVLPDRLAWLSSDPAVATVNDSTGEVTAVAEGTAIITATSTATPQRTGTRAVTVDAVPAVVSTTPAEGATEVWPADNVVIVFSEAVNASTSSFSLDCGGLQSFTVSGSGTSTITLNPVNALPPFAMCTVTVVASQVSDADANDGPNNLAAGYLFSFRTEQVIVFNP